MDQLIEAARTAHEHAYVPYSGYRVGAALETVDGTVYTGANVEIANYTNSMHAEALALAKAVLDGETRFERMAVSSGPLDGVTPCGMCRQTLVEFCDGSFRILCDEGESVETYRLGALLPHSFGGEYLTDE